MGIGLKITDASNGKKPRSVTGIILSVYRVGRKSGLNPPKGVISLNMLLRRNTGGYNSTANGCGAVLIKVVLPWTV